LSSDRDVHDALSQAFFRDRNVAEEGAGPGDPRRVILGRMLLYVAPVFLILAGVDLFLRSGYPPGKLLPHMQIQAAFYTQKVNLFERSPAPDVVFLGSSRVREGLNSKVFAEALSRYWNRPAKVFNLGLNQALAEEYRALAASHFPEPAPPYVVIALSGTEVVRAHDFNYASRFLWTLPDLASYLGRTSFEHFDVKHVEYFIESQLCRVWYLFAQRDAFQGLIEETAKRVAGLDVDIAEGETLRSRVLAADGYEPFNKDPKTLEEVLQKREKAVRLPARDRIRDPDAFNEEGAAVLRLTVEALEARGCRVAFVELPPSPYLQRRSPVVHGEPFRTWMEKVAGGLGVLFVPVLSRENGLTNAMYQDFGHLSVEGAKRYSRLVFDRLREAGFFDA
jgi:hypothetical protein